MQRMFKYVRPPPCVPVSSAELLLLQPGKQQLCERGRVVPREGRHHKKPLTMTVNPSIAPLPYPPPTADCGPGVSALSQSEHGASDTGTSALQSLWCGACSDPVRIAHARALPPYWAPKSEWARFPSSPTRLEGFGPVTLGVPTFGSIWQLELHKGERVSSPSLLRCNIVVEGSITAELLTSTVCHWVQSLADRLPWKHAN